jgi:calcineurin-like phosphoesterase family protein
MSNVFFTADTHFRHQNKRGSGIIQFCNRPFADTQEMDEALIANWNRVVGNKDSVYHLGDFGMGNCADIFYRLKGQKFLLRGSHDRDAIKYNWAWTKCCYELKIQGAYIWLSHRPHRAWERSFHGSWHLFGHVHGRLPPLGKSFDVGVDVWNFTPVSFEEVQDKMKGLEQVDV